MKEHNRLTEQQHKWVYKKLSGFNCIFVGIHGSILYGLDREGSDIDIKAIYMPSKMELVTGQAIKTCNYKNNELDIEIEIKSLSSFLKSAASCDTNCVDLLHTPDNMTIYKDTLWDKVVKHRNSLYAKNMKGIVGYVKTHSKKYTNKIDRLKELEGMLIYTKFNSLCTPLAPEINVGTKGHVDYNLDVKLGDLKLSNFCEGYKYINLVREVGEGEQPYLEVCGKKYLLNLALTSFQDAIQVEINRYGKRSNKGLDKGIDSKSLSHALRVLLQLKEIATTQTLTFPLKDVAYVKKVKFGEVTDVSEVLNHIDTLYDECMVLLKDSNLPEEVDLTEIYKVVEDYYFS